MSRIISSGVDTLLPPPWAWTVMPWIVSEKTHILPVIGSSSLDHPAALMIACSPDLVADPDAIICFACSSREINMPLPPDISVTAIESELSMTQSVRSPPVSRLWSHPNTTQASPDTIRNNRISERRGDDEKLVERGDIWVDYMRKMTERNVCR
jgi:hypothetical protein